ncbi:heme peroxidase [Zopfochytrium polystomum]|nr:heme peroxidase [Zopfochytrium polystomum]
MAQASALLILFLVACNYGRAWPSMKQPRGENREELLLHSRAAAASLPFEVQSMDGKGNNVANPMWGAVGNPYQRSVPPLYGPGQSPSGASRPGARVISNALFSRKPYLQNTEGVTDFLPAWGVMLHLDITILPRNASEPFPIAVPTGDPIFDPTGQGGHTINFLRSQYVAVNATTNSRVVTNAFTSFIDCSGLYGNSMDEMASMRLFSGGLLKFQILPTGEFPPRFVGGPLDGHFTYNSDIINMMPHLTVTYTLFFREHNRRARILAARHPDWSDEMLFQRARRWVIAVVQKTTAYFYFPDLTGQQLPPYSGYDPTVDPTIDLFFANVAFRYGHSAINPLVLRLDDYGNQVPEGHLIFRDAFYKSICDEVTTYGIESILRGFATQNDQVIDTTFVEDMRSFLPLADPGGHFDIAAIGLQRARELGIPDYNTCRKAFNLAPARTWSDVTSKTEVQRILSQLYTNISDFDAYVGAFAEDHIHKNSLIGPLMRVSLMDQFRRLRDGDRFWYENVGVLTSEDHADLSNYTLGSMVLSNSRIPHYPSDPFVGVNASSLYFLSGSATVPNSGSSGFDGSVQVLGRLRLGWNISMDDGTVTFEFASNASGWFGFGFGLNMLGTDIYFCTDSGNGSFTVYDSWSTQTQPPTSDVSQGSSNDIFKVADVTNLQTRSLRVVTFTRKLDTGDPLDAVIKTGSTPVIFAFSDSLDLIWHGPVNRVAGYVNFFSTSSSDFVAVKTSASMSLKLLHGVTMYIAFALVFPIGVFVVRYYHVNKWLVIHETMMKMVTSNR